MVFLTYKKQGSNLEFVVGGGDTSKSHGYILFLKRFENRGTISHRHDSGRPSRITVEGMRIAEDQMQLDDEITAMQLRSLLAQQSVL